MLYLVNMFNPSDIKKEFPIFDQHPDLIFVDNASTTHKPFSVITTVSDYYSQNNSNVHRAVYDLGVKTDEIYINTKKEILSFYGLENTHQAIYTAGTTDAFNKIARALEHIVKSTDNIIVSEMEHHSNLVPWQELCSRTDAELRVVKITEYGDLDYGHLETLLDENTFLVSLTHISNTLGTVNDLSAVKELMTATNAFLLVDAAQSSGLYASEFPKIDADAFIFSAHKMFGPSGIGVLLAKETFLENLQPFNYGGGMVREVEQLKSSYRADLSRFEAGTPPTAQIAGLSSSMKFLNQTSSVQARTHCTNLAVLLRTELSKIGVGCLGNPEKKSSVLSTHFKDIHPHDVATYLNDKHIAVRAGHHCTQLIMKKYGIPASIRFSFSIYNEEQEIDEIIHAIKSMKAYFR